MDAQRNRRFPVLSSTPLRHLTVPKVVCLVVTACSSIVIVARALSRGSL